MPCTYMHDRAGCKVKACTSCHSRGNLFRTAARQLDPAWMAQACADIPRLHVLRYTGAVLISPHMRV